MRLYGINQNSSGGNNSGASGGNSSSTSTPKNPFYMPNLLTGFWTRLAPRNWLWLCLATLATLKLP